MKFKENAKENAIVFLCKNFK